MAVINIMLRFTIIVIEDFLLGVEYMGITDSAVGYEVALRRSEFN